MTGFGRNLGPKSTSMLLETGISNREQLISLGAPAAYARLKFQFGTRVSLNFLYALEACIRDCDWRTLPEPVRRELRAFHLGLK